MTDAADVRSGSENASATIGRCREHNRILILDDDVAYRRGLVAALDDARFLTMEERADRRLPDTVMLGRDVDIILMDPHMLGQDGVSVLAASRDSGFAVPVIFLTTSEAWLEEDAALALDGVDIVDKKRSVKLLLRRIYALLRNSVEPSEDGGSISVGALTIQSDILRAHWAGTPVPLTLTEFRVVSVLAAMPGRDVSYRQIYDAVQAPGFVAGYGPDGHRVAVRSLIKRIRQKFRAIDSAFDRIENYPSFGYRWRA